MLTEKEKAEDLMVQSAFQELIDDYLATKHRKRIEIITKAFNFAKEAHKDIRRRSGEPYIMHPIAVAKIVCNEIGLGSTSICSALLHDVVEDTDYTVEDIENIFGPKIALIVDGLTKISGGIFGDQASAQAENFKKLLLTMSSDIRVILIKVADRLHNMRTLGSMLPSKQYKIAGETLYIYAPLANRLGLNRIKVELENLSFKYEHPEEYNSIQKKLEDTASQRDLVFNNFTTPIRTRLDQMGINYQLVARIKSIYSIWKKMKAKHIPFEEIYDILAVRIIFTPKSKEEELNNCFDIYVGISKIYKPHPDRLRDWVSHPKANGYQALHVTLMANNGQWIEVQIRSDRMNDIAEQGFAAHWKYKEGGGSEDEGELEKWLKTIKEILEDPQPDAMDFLDTIKLNLFSSEIMVFTPKGDIKTMPQNSTALDFAFALHTDLGLKCIGAKVNHKLVPLSHKLKSGDQIEILSAKQVRVEPYWEKIATSAKAKNEISSFFKKQHRAYQNEGEEKLIAFFDALNLKYDQTNLNKIIELSKYNTKEKLTYAIGSEEINLEDIDKDKLIGKPTPAWKKYFSFGKANKQNEFTPIVQPIRDGVNKKETYIIKPEEVNKKYKLASCCNPIPGDPALGCFDNKGVLTIHKRQCPVATRLKSSFGERIIATDWDKNETIDFLIPIFIKGIDRIGLLNEVTEMIFKELRLNMKGTTFSTTDGIFEGKIDFTVKDVSEIKNICDKLRKIPGVKQVTRIED